MEGRNRLIASVCTFPPLYPCTLLQRWAWASVSTAGIPPAPRARHAAVSNALLTLGGPDPSVPSFAAVDLRPGIIASDGGPLAHVTGVTSSDAGADEDVAAATSTPAASSSGPGGGRTSVTGSPAGGGGRLQNSSTTGAAPTTTASAGGAAKAGSSSGTAVVALAPAGPVVGTPACPAILLVFGGICGPPTQRPVVGTAQVCTVHSHACTPLTEPMELLGVRVGLLRHAPSSSSSPLRTFSLKHPWPFQ